MINTAMMEILATSQWMVWRKKIRLLDLDTPEISKPKCNAELELGIKARNYLNNLIANASIIEFKTEYLEDYFGRILSYLIIDGEDASSKIIKNQLGVVYNRKQKYDWCQDLKVNETTKYTE